MEREHPYLDGLSPEEFNNVNPEFVQRLLGSAAVEYYVPTDPMDDLQCESCQ